MKKNKPFFSVIIPTFNRKNILLRSINSVLLQTFTNFELIIIDNGSTDNTKDWIASNIKDSRLRYFYQKGSGSPASPRNYGMKLSIGKWVCFLDSDDIWTLDKLNKVSNEIKINKNIDVICHNERIFYENYNRQGKVLRYGPVSKNLYKDMLIYGNRLSTSATSIRLNFLKDNNLKFNESKGLAMVEDYDLWLNLSNKGAKFKFIQKHLGFYTVGSLNMISNSELFCNNLNNLLKTHTFDIQRFAESNELWATLQVRHDICQIRYMEVGFYNKTYNFFKTFLVHPIIFLDLIIGYSKKKLVLIFWPF